MVQQWKRHAGDTIIEVMLAMAVIGLVLGAAFGIANRATITARNTQERTDALKIAESQLELMQAYKSDVRMTNAAFSGTGFCMVGSGTPDYMMPATNALKCQNQNGQEAGGLYSIVITQPTAAPGSAFEISVTWERLGASSAVATNNLDSVVLYYKLGAL